MVLTLTFLPSPKTSRVLHPHSKFPIFVLAAEPRLLSAPLYQIFKRQLSLWPEYQRATTPQVPFNLFLLHLRPSSVDCLLPTASTSVCRCTTLWRQWATVATTSWWRRSFPANSQTTASWPGKVRDSGEFLYRPTKTLRFPQIVFSVARCRCDG